MIWIFLLFIIVCFIGATFNFRSGFKDYLGKVQTNAIRGIFAIIIFFSHFNSYVSIGEEVGDNIYLKIFSFIGQLMVAPFFFYSGYGIYCSAKKKPNYIKAFPRHRLLKTFLFFTLAVIPYLAIVLIQKTQYSVPHIIFAFTGWTSLGNSNWFMFAILSLYVFTFIAAHFTERIINSHTILIILILSIAYILLVNYFKHGVSYWTDTILCFTSGMLYAHHKIKLDTMLKNKYLITFMSSLLLFFALYFLKNHLGGLPYIFTYNLLATIFCVLINMLTIHIKISNHIIQFLGAYSFEIYILQRAPDFLLQPILGQNTIAFLLLSLATTIIISIAFKRLCNIITKKFLKI